MSRPFLAIRCAAVLLSASVLPQIAVADAPAFQSFFSSVCANATGSLATRCAETPGGSGALSSDSQDSLNPTQFLATNEAALANARATTREAQDRLEVGREGLADDADAGDLGGRWGSYLQLRGEYADRDRSGRERGFEADSEAIQLGLDYRLSDTAFVGALFGFDRSDSEFDADAPGVNFTPSGDDGDSEAESWSITLYGSKYLMERLFIDGSVTYGSTDYDFGRRAVFQETTRAVSQTNVSSSASTDGSQVSLSGTIGYDFQDAGWTVSPYVRATYLDTDVDGYRERDASGLQMALEDASQSSLTAVLGVRGSYAISRSWGVIVPQFRLEYEHEFDRDAVDAEASFLLDSTQARFRLEGDDPDRDTFNAALGVVLVLPNGWTPFAEYEGLIGHSRQDRHRVLLGIRKEF